MEQALTIFEKAFGPGRRVWRWLTGKRITAREFIQILSDMYSQATKYVEISDLVERMKQSGKIKDIDEFYSLLELIKKNRQEYGLGTTIDQLYGSAQSRVTQRNIFLRMRRRHHLENSEVDRLVELDRINQENYEKRTP